MDFDYDFAKQMILVILPVIGGIFTSKWITNSWQARKESMEIKRKILELMDESYHKYYSLIANFGNQIYRAYDDYTTRFDTNGNLLSDKLIFPTNVSDMPLNMFKNEFMIFQKERNEIAYAKNRFGSSLALYFPSLLSKINVLEIELETAFHSVIALYHCQDRMSFDLRYNVMKESLNKARDVQQKLAFQIIKSKIEV